MSDEIRYLAEVISKQNVRGVTWLLLSAYNKMWKERRDLKTELSSERNNLKIEKVLSLSYIEKKNENTKGMSKWSFYKEISLDQISQHLFSKTMEEW